MFFLEKSNLDTKVKQNKDSNLQHLIELLWTQIKQQIPTWGCILVSQQYQSQNTVEALCLENPFWQNKINQTLLNNLELNFSQSESEVYFDSGFLGYVYLITKTTIHSRYLIFFLNNDRILSLEQKQILKTYNQLLQQYLNLENKYQQKQNEFKLLENRFYQMGHHLRNPLAEISIMAETIYLSSTTNFCQVQAEDIKKKITDINLDIRDFLQLHREANNQNITQDIRGIFQQSIDNLKNLIYDKKLYIKYPRQTLFLSIDSFKN